MPLSTKLPRFATALPSSYGHCQINADPFGLPDDRSRAGIVYCGCALTGTGRTPRGR
jgi:hypothetical protein